MSCFKNNSKVVLFRCFVENYIVSFIVFGRPFVKWFALCCRTVVCLSVCLSVCNVGVLWPNGCLD